MLCYYSLVHRPASLFLYQPTYSTHNILKKTLPWQYPKLIQYSETWILHPTILSLFTQKDTMVKLSVTSNSLSLMIMNYTATPAIIFMLSPTNKSNIKLASIQSHILHQRHHHRRCLPSISLTTTSTRAQRETMKSSRTTLALIMSH